MSRTTIAAACIAMLLFSPCYSVCEDAENTEASAVVWEYIENAGNKIDQFDGSFGIHGKYLKYSKVTIESTSKLTLGKSHSWGITPKGLRSREDYLALGSVMNQAGISTLQMIFQKNYNNKWNSYWLSLLLLNVPSLERIQLHTTPEIFEALAHCPNLKGVSLFLPTAFTEEELREGLVKLARLKNLQELDLSGSLNVLQCLPEFPFVEKMRLSLLYKEPSEYEVIPELFPKLSCFHCIVRADADLADFPTIQNLKELSFGTPYSFDANEDAMQLQGIPDLLLRTPQLETLRLGNCSSEGIVAISLLHELSRLQIDQASQIGDWEWTSLSDSKNISCLHLTQPNVGDGYALLLKELPLLRNIVIVNATNELSGKGKEDLRSVTGLDSIQIFGHPYSKQGSSLLECFSGCTNLRTVTFKGMMTDTIGGLLAKCSLEFVELSCLNIRDSHIEALSKCKKLVSANLPYIGNVTDKGISMLGECVNLTRLRFGFCPYISPKTISNLINKLSLDLISIDKSSFSKNDLSILQLPKFFSINCMGAEALRSSVMVNQEYRLNMIVGNVKYIKGEGVFFPPYGSFPDSLTTSFQGYRWRYFSNSSSATAKDANRFVLIAFPLDIRGGEKIYYIDENLVLMFFSLGSNKQIGRFTELKNSDVLFKEDKRIPGVEFISEIMRN